MDGYSRTYIILFGGFSFSCPRKRIELRIIGKRVPLAYVLPTQRTLQFMACPMTALIYRLGSYSTRAA